MELGQPYLNINFHYVRLFVDFLYSLKHTHTCLHSLTYDMLALIAINGVLTLITVTTTMLLKILHSSSSSSSFFFAVCASFSCSFYSDIGIVVLVVVVVVFSYLSSYLNDWFTVLAAIM